jgi:hypothetical protein
MNVRGKEPYLKHKIIQIFSTVYLSSVQVADCTFTSSTVRRMDWILGFRKREENST